MATPENTFIASVHRHLPANLYRMKNNNMYNAGIPDVWYSGKEADLWVEYKFTLLPKQDNTLIVPDLSELQKNWLRQRHAEGRNVAVVIGCKEGGVMFPKLTWESPQTTKSFKLLLSKRETIAHRIRTFTNARSTEP